MNKAQFFLRVLLLLGSWATGTAHALTVESGDFTDLIAGLKALAFGNGSGLYVTPTAMQLNGFTALANNLANSDINLADSQAAVLNYELIGYTDTADAICCYSTFERYFCVGSALRSTGHRAAYP